MMVERNDVRLIRKRVRSREPYLSQRVYHFINEAQANYRRFFSAEGPDPWKMILQKLTQDSPVHSMSIEQLRERLETLAAKQQRIERSGLGDHEWGLTWIKQCLQTAVPNDDPSIPLTVLSTYLELLDTRIDQQLLMAERLITFEKLLSSFFANKRVSVSSEDGFMIETSAGQKLNEQQLSSGEFHLLYLMVRALVALRRGTVIAIDEPELSIHISWQRKLVKALCDCAARGEPQFLFATHSPDIARGFKDSMIRLGGEKNGN